MRHDAYGVRPVVTIVLDGREKNLGQLFDEPRIVTYIGVGRYLDPPLPTGQALLMELLTTLPRMRSTKHAPMAMRHRNWTSR